MYTKNIGTCDRMMRFAIAIVLVGLAYYKLSGVLQLIVFAIAGVMIITSSIRYCPLYPLIGRDTTKCTCGMCGSCKCDGKGKCKGDCKNKKESK